MSWALCPIADALGAVPALPTLPSAIDQLVLVTVAEQAQSILPSLIEPAPGVLETGLSGIIDEESMNQTTNPSGGNFPGGREGRTRESHSAELRVGSPLSKRAKSESRDRPPSLPSRTGSRGGIWAVYTHYVGRLY